MGNENGDETLSKTAKALEQARLFSNNLINTSNVMIVGLDNSGTIMVFNPAAEHITGYTKEELEGKNWFEVLVPRDKYPDVWEEFNRLLAGGKAEIFENPILSKNGEERIISWSNSDLMVDGKTAGTISFGMDITDRRNTEKALEEKERLLRKIAENYPNSYLAIIEKDYTVSFCSGQEFKKQNLDPAAYCGLTLDEIFADLAPIVKKNYGKTFAGKETSFELYIDGQHQHYKTVPLYDKDGGIPRILAVVENITQRKIAEQKLKASLREKELLLKEIHHRVKNNMAVIAGMLNLQAASFPDPKIKKILKNTHQRIHSMALVHENLYKSSDLAQIDFSRYLPELVKQIFQGTGISDEHITLKVDAGNTFLGVDSAIPLGLIINELVTNAIKHAFSSPNPTNGIVEIRLNEIDGGYLLTVSDNGVGLPEDIDSQSISSFGLYLVDLLCHQLSGELEIHRSGGTTFRITFPK